MDVKQHNFPNTSEKETAILLQNCGFECVSLNWKMKSETSNNDEGEIDGVFCDEKNQFYLIYDDSTQKDDRQSKISTFLNKWKDLTNQNKLRKDLSLKDYSMYVIYIDKSVKDNKVESINYILDEFTKIIYNNDIEYFVDIYNRIGMWAKNDFLNYLEIKPRKVTKEKINATQIYVGNTPAYIFADRVENILSYSYISRRRDGTSGYQRMVDKNRVKNMSKLIQEDKINAFPNSILLNCVDAMGITPKQRSECPCNVDIDLPNNFSSCRVVDGQHRLLAFSKLNSTIQDYHSLPIVLFQKMSNEDEIKTFIEINDNQKGIDPNLIYSLKSDMDFQAGTNEYLEKVAVEIIKKLNRDAPFFAGNIKFGYVDEAKKKTITLTTLVQSFLDFKIVDHGKGFLQEDEKDLEKPYMTIKEIAVSIIQKDRANLNFYKSNNGAMLILKYSSLLHKNLELKNINISIDEAVQVLVDSVILNKNNLDKKYGIAGFNALFNIIIQQIKTTSSAFASFETEFKLLK